MGLWAWFRAARPLNIVSAPFIYSMIVPFVLLDLWLTIYHAICFPLYNIPKVKRSAYFAIDRHHLAYLNGLEKLNCMYYGYEWPDRLYANLVADGTVLVSHQARSKTAGCPSAVPTIPSLRGFAGLSRQARTIPDRACQREMTSLCMGKPQRVDADGLTRCGRLGGVQ